MKSVNNNSISKSSTSGCCLEFDLFFASFSPAFLIKVLFIKKKRVYDASGRNSEGLTNVSFIYLIYFICVHKYCLFWDGQFTTLEIMF